MTDDRLAALERRIGALEDERAIARLIASYGPLVDAGEAAAVADLWTAEGSYDVGDWTMSGRDELLAMVDSDAHRGLLTRGACHFFGPPVITVDGDQATATCQSIILLRRKSGGYHAWRAGVHLLRLQRSAAGWRIVSRVARQLDGTGEAAALVAQGIPA